MAGHKLVVGNLPPDITKSELQTVFSTYGTVDQIQINETDRTTGLSWAFVYYEERRSGEDAITVLNDQYKIRTDASQPIQVWWGKGSDRNTEQAPATTTHPRDSGTHDDGYKLFVGCLPDDITEEELKTVFGTYGEVTHVVVMKASPTSGLRAAFVFYTSRDSGEDAIKVLNNVYKIRTDAEQTIQVKWAREKDDGRGGGVAESTSGFKLFVGSLPSDVSEDELRSVFGTYGEVNVVHLLSPTNQTGNKAALVFYDKKESAEDAIKVLDGQYKIRQDMDQPILVKWGKDKSDSKGNDKGGAGKGGGGKGGAGKGGAGKDTWQQSGWGADSWSGGGSRQDAWQDGSKGGKGGWDGGKGSWDGGKGGWDGGKGSWDGGKGSWDGGKGGWDSNSGKGAWQDSGKGWSAGGGSGSSGGWGSSWQDDSWQDGGKGWQSGGGKSKDSGRDKGGKDKGGKDKGGGGKGSKGGKSDGASGKLFVGGLPLDTEEKALEYVFGAYGKVEKVHIMKGNNRNGCIAAFVDMSSLSDAETAIATLHDKYEIREGFGPITVKHSHSGKQGRSAPY